MHSASPEQDVPDEEPAIFRNGWTINVERDVNLTCGHF
jgi:hypothetical protein